MKLKELLQIRKGDIISIVGAGGKTTLMFSLGEELREESKVLVTTTTKIYHPRKHQFDFIAIDKADFSKHNNKNYKGIYIYGSGINNEKKLVGLSCELLEEQTPYFDYILVEADGSKEKSIKGWKDNEPVISNKTNKTIGVLNIQAIGQEINNDNIHRLKEFIDITNSCEGELISIENIILLIFHHKGLFKNSLGDRILFINKVESKEDMILANKLLTRIFEENNKYIKKIVLGSLKTKNIWEGIYNIKKVEGGSEDD